jgi:uncharacterized protein (DUF433 family)
MDRITINPNIFGGKPIIRGVKMHLETIGYDVIWTGDWKKALVTKKFYMHITKIEFF